MIRASRLVVLAVTSTALAVAYGCGSSSGGGGGTGPGGTYSSGLPGSTSAGSLTGDQFTQFCESAAQYVATKAPAQELLCKFAGESAAAAVAVIGTSATDQSVQQACTDTYNSCINTKAADAGSGTNPCTKPSGACTATVTQIETCVNESVSTVQTAVNAIPACSSLTVASLKATGSGGASGGTSTIPTLPQSCTDANTACPGFLGGLTGMP